MKKITFIEREMTKDEYSRMISGFKEHSLEHNVQIQTPERIGFVVLDGDKFVGCSSGLANKNGNKYCMWFYLSDLFIEKAYRGHGLGKQILRKLEERIMSLGMQYIWTWTDGYEAPGFYKKQGYEVFCEMKNWYLSGHSRFGMRKRLVE